MIGSASLQPTRAWEIVFDEHGDSGMDLVEFLTQFQDHLAPRLDTYEQAIYLYVFRHTRLIGQDEAVLGFKSAARENGHRHWHKRHGNV